MSLSLKGLQRVALHLLCLVPALWLFFLAVTDGLGANPAEALLRDLGLWALRFVCLALAVTPLRLHTHTPQLARYRRMLGLFVAFYASLHLLAYGWLDMGFDVVDIGRDILKRPFILVGFTVWLLLLPLTFTSTNAAVRALGGRAWQALHRLVYVIAPLALLHFFWMRAGKNDFAEVMVYAAIIGVLLLERLFRYLKPRGVASR